MQNHLNKDTRTQRRQDTSKVYLKRLDDWQSEENINDALLKAWQAIENIQDFINTNDFTEIKLTFGEEGTSGYIKPAWLRALINELKQKTQNLFFVETSTLYRERGLMLWVIFTWQPATATALTRPAYL